MSTDVKPDTVTFTIDGREVTVPKGTLVIRAAEENGIAIPRFCDHPLLDPVACCRACVVEVPDAGNGRAMKPQPACALQAMPNMVVETAASSQRVAKHQSGMLEFLLINHPLDCPICDKGGECPLQNQTMSFGPGQSRYEGAKRTYPKPIHISENVLIDRERCVLCQRCSRFSTQISGDEFISLAERGALSQIANYQTKPYESYFSGNIIQICPVGALTSADYRFQARPFDLVSTQVTCENCAAGCQLRTDHRHFQVKRRLAGNAPEINEEWSCDKGRFGFYSGRGEDRLTTPLVRVDGELVPASWPEAIDRAVAGLKVGGQDVGVLPGGQLTLENAYAYSRFARVVLGTNNIDFRARPYGVDELGFLAAEVAGKTLADSVTYTDLQNAKQVILVGLEPEEECPMVFLRLRKAVRKNHAKVTAIAPYLSRGNQKLNAELIASVPGQEAKALESLEVDADTIVLAGERLSSAPGALQQLVSLGQRGASFAWIPRRSGELAGIEAGCLPNLLPGGRPVSDAGARVDLQAAWGVESLPAEPGLCTKRILQQAADGKVKTLVVGGLEVADLPEVAVAKQAFDKAFVVSLERRLSDVSQYADVVFPVCLLEEQYGTLINWEHRLGHVNQVIDHRTNPMSDVRVLAALADAMESDLGFRSPAQAKASYDEIADWRGVRVEMPAGQSPNAPSGELILASWHLAIDDSRSLDGAHALKSTAPNAVVRMSAATAKKYGVTAGQMVAVATDNGQLAAPAQIIETMIDDVVWLPQNSGTRVTQTLQAAPGDSVQLNLVGGQA